MSTPIDTQKTDSHCPIQHTTIPQLYEIDDNPKRKEFLDELFAFMQKRGTPINRLPIMAKQVNSSRCGETQDFITLRRFLTCTSSTTWWWPEVAWWR